VDETRALALEIVEDAGWMEAKTASAPKVTATEGPDEGKTLSLDEPDRAYILGRAPDADLELTDPDASRVHLELRRDDAGVMALDAGSKNGTVLNGRPMPARRALRWKANVPLRIGETSFSLSDAVAEKLAELTDAPDESIAEGEESTFARKLDDGQKPKGNAATPAADAALDDAEASSTDSGAPSTASDGDDPSDAEELPSGNAHDVAGGLPAETSGTTRRIPWLDVAIVLLAVVVLAASAVGLYWLFAGGPNP